MSTEVISDASETSRDEDASVNSVNTDDTSLAPPPREAEATLSDSIDFIGQDMTAAATMGSHQASRRPGSAASAVPGAGSASQAKTKADLNANDHTIISTPDLCDNYADTVRVLDPLFTNYGGRQRFAGTVYTVKCFEDDTRLRELANTPGHGRILVVDGGGSRRRALMGDMIAMDFADRGWAGVVVFGSVRDVDELGRLPLGVAALGAHPVECDSGREGGQVNVPVTFAGVTVRPGDSMCCDRNGIVVNSMPMIMTTGADLSAIPHQDHHYHRYSKKRSSYRNPRQNDADLLGSIPNGEMT